MKNFYTLLPVLTVALFLFSCTEDPLKSEEPIVPRPLKHLKGGMYESTTWYRDTVYVLDSTLFIKPGNKLTIEPGTLIKGNKPMSALIVLKGAGIHAEGTREHPIVFTSIHSPGERDWGGIIIFGIDEVPFPQDAHPFPYLSNLGGNSTINESPGIKLKFVRIEFAGINPFIPSEHSSSLTLIGVEKVASINNIMISSGSDFGMRIYGGGAHLKKIICSDNWNTDVGIYYSFSGTIQYLMVYQNPKNQAFYYDHKSMFLTFNTENTSHKPVLSNASLVGLANRNYPVFAKIQEGSNRGVVRQGSGGINLVNSLVYGAVHGGYVYRKNQFDQFENEYNADIVYCRGNIFAGVLEKDYPVRGGSFAALGHGGYEEPEQSHVERFNSQNYILSPAELKWDFVLESTGFTNTPSLLPLVGSKLLDNSLVKMIPVDGLENVDFIGAFGTEDWTKGWVNWDPENTEYE